MLAVRVVVGREPVERADEVQQICQTVFRQTGDAGREKDCAPKTRRLRKLSFRLRTVAVVSVIGFSPVVVGCANRGRRENFWAGRSERAGKEVSARRAPACGIRVDALQARAAGLFARPQWPCWQRQREEEPDRSTKSL